MRQGVALAVTAIGGDLLIPAGEGNRLEGDEGDLLGVVHGEPDDGADLVIVDFVDQGGHQNDLDAGFVHVVDRSQLDVEEIADLAVAVGVVADPVELQVGVAKAGLGGLARKLLALGELNAVGRRLHTVVSQVARQPHRL